MILARVQHHPSRAELLERLLPHLGELPVEVISHDATPTNPWEGYKLCLSGIPPAVTHLLVIQDDALPCRNFSQAVGMTVAAAPTYPICYFVSKVSTRTRYEILRAAKVGASYTEIAFRDFVPVVATLWPVGHAADLLDWHASSPARRVPDRADDGVVGRWMRARRQTILATIPSLVEHPDDVPSTIGRPTGYRTALLPIGSGDPLEIDWAYS